jgi:hypothetical protein
MSEPIPIKVLDLINSPRAVDPSDGERIFDEICPLLKSGQKVELSFAGITMVITAFLNAAIGKLYGELTEQQFDELLEIRDLRDAFQPSLDSSIKWSKTFFKNRESLGKAVLEGFEDEE